MKMPRSSGHFSNGSSFITGEVVAVFSLFQKKNPVCGLDLGTDWVKLVRMIPEGKDARLASMARMVRPLEGKDQAEAVGGALRTLWNRLGLKDRVVVSSMSGHDVIIKRVSLQTGAEKSLDDAIRKEARQYIPFDVNDVYLDYEVVGKSGEGDRELDVLLVASKKKVVHELGRSLEQAGLSLSVVDVDAFALNNCFEFNYPEFGDEPVYLLDIGAQQSIFCVYWQKHPFFLREAAFGGRNLTQDLARVLNIGRAEAEKLKTSGTCDDKGVEEAARKQVRATVLNWVEELRRLIGFYQSLVPDAKLAEHLLLTGGGSMVSGLETLLSEELGVTAQYLDPWRNVRVDAGQFDKEYLRQVGPQFAVAVGLALREIVQEEKRK